MILYGNYIFIKPDSLSLFADSRNMESVLIRSVTYDTYLTLTDIASQLARGGPDGINLAQKDFAVSSRAN